MSDETSIQPVSAPPSEAALAELAQGDISQLKPEQRGQFLLKLCEKFGLNPFSRPFDFITVKDQSGRSKTVLYANRTASDQLRYNRQIEAEVVYAGPLKLGEMIRSDVYCVELDMKLPLKSDEGAPALDGKRYQRVERAVGCVAVGGYQGDKLILMTGEAMANAVMKCWTKALRRGTLAICGLGFPDESEVSDSPLSRSEVPLGPRTLQPPVESGYSAPEAQTRVGDATVTHFPRPLPAAKPPVR